MTFVLKMCRPCYQEEFGEAMAGTITWGRQCDVCKKPTATMTTLVKVVRADG